MINSIFHLWHSLPLIIRLPLEFWFGIILMRGIVAKDITSWLEDRGFIKKKEESVIYRSMDYAYFHGRKIIPGLERQWAIWMHYKNRSAGQGHNSDSVLHCSQDGCAIF